MDGNKSGQNTPVTEVQKNTLLCSEPNMQRRNHEDQIVTDTF